MLSLTTLLIKNLSMQKRAMCNSSKAFSCPTRRFSREFRSLCLIDSLSKLIQLQMDDHESQQALQLYL
jgi:hypothetical protein